MVSGFLVCSGLPRALIPMAQSSMKYGKVLGAFVWMRLHGRGVVVHSPSIKSS